MAEDWSLCESRLILSSWSSTGVITWFPFTFRWSGKLITQNLSYCDTIMIKE